MTASGETAIVKSPDFDSLQRLETEGKLCGAAIRRCRRRPVGENFHAQSRAKTPMTCIADLGPRLLHPWANIF